MKFLISLFICLFFVGCLPHRIPSEDEAEVKNNIKNNIKDSLRDLTPEEQQLKISDSLSSEDKDVIDYLDKQLLASINGLENKQEKAQYTSKLREFMQWLYNNPDKGRELAGVGKSLQALISLKSGNNTFDNLESIQDNNKRTLQEEIKDIFDFAYNAFNSRNVTNEEVLKQLKDTLSDNENNHLEALKNFQVRQN
nr:hypothetical protein LKV13_04475 [Borrelia sp. BU AG58]